MNEPKRTVTLGSDPEIAVVKNGNIVPACDLFGGDKGKPVPAGPEGGWLEDGVALELNPAPESDPTKAMYNLNALLRAATDHGKPKGVGLHYPVTEHTFRSTALTSPKASAFGCAQDFCAYEIGVAREGTMTKAMAEIDPCIRFYGGHLHLGVTNWPSALPKFVAVRFLDVLLGTTIARKYEPRRMNRDFYYGLPGLYRETAYGVEYRSPGNGWLMETVDTSPYTYARLGRIGQMFAQFEKYERPLVEFYNDMDWDAFQQAMISKNWAQISRVLSKHVERTPAGHEVLTFGDMKFSLFSWMHESEMFKKMQNPNKKTKSSIYKMAYDQMVVDAMNPAEAAGRALGVVPPPADPREEAFPELNLGNVQVAPPDMHMIRRRDAITESFDIWAEAIRRAKDAISEQVDRDWERGLFNRNVRDDIIVEVRRVFEGKSERGYDVIQDYYDDNPDEEGVIDYHELELSQPVVIRWEIPEGARQYAIVI